MKAVGLSYNADGDLVPIGSDECAMGVSKLLYIDNGSCGYAILDGFKSLELVPYDLSSEDDADEFSSTVVAAAETYCGGSTIILSARNERGEHVLLVADDYEPEAMQEINIVLGTKNKNTSVEFIYTESEDMSDEIEDYVLLLDHWN